MDRYKLIDVPAAAGAGTYPIGVNDRGQIVGFYSGGPGEAGFILDKNGYHSLLLDSSSTILSDINNKGEIVGYGLSGFTYTPTSGFTPFSIDGNGAVPYGVSNNGEIVGYYFDNVQGNAHGFAINPVPEPGALSLMSIGLLSFLAYATMAAKMKAIARRKNSPPTRRTAKDGTPPAQRAVRSETRRGKTLEPSQDRLPRSPRRLYWRSKNGEEVRQNDLRTFKLDQKAMRSLKELDKRVQ
jgi:hypothetical protein